MSFKDKDNNDIPIDPKKDAETYPHPGDTILLLYHHSTQRRSDPTFTINIDDVTGIECYMLSNNKTHLLRPGKNTFSFNGYIEDSVLIGREDGKNYSPLYSVKVNGEEQSPIST